MASAQVSFLSRGIVAGTSINFFQIVESNPAKTKLHMCRAIQFYNFDTYSDILHKAVSRKMLAVQMTSENVVLEIFVSFLAAVIGDS